jgi:hypothetical protein
LIFPILVVAGVSAEWLYESDSSLREAAYAKLLDAENVKLKNTARDATERAKDATQGAAQALAGAAAANEHAADAESKAISLLAENIELERALAPRDFDQGRLVAAINSFPRIPIFIVPLDREEPKQLAEYINFALTGIKIADAQPWNVTILPPESWAPEGITVQFVDSRLGDNPDKTSEQAAVSLCEQFKSEGISVGTEPLSGLKLRHSPNTIPANALIIQIGANPDFSKPKVHRGCESAISCFARTT